MSARSRAPARHLPRGRPRAGLRRTIALLPIAISLAAGAAGIASADGPRGVTALTAAEAGRTGLAIALVRHPELDPELVEMRVDGRAPHRRLLAVAPDAATLAVADRPDPASATLSLARADGSQLQIALPGLLAAAFAPDASWLAVVDGSGSLWNVVAETGVATRLADGPFLGPVTVEPGGTLILASVASVEAPFISQLVRFDPADGSVSSLSDDRLVYGSTLLADGSIAVVAHEPGGTVVRQLTSQGERLLADLGPGAINVAISPDGARIAWERHGDGVYLLDATKGRARRIGSGGGPRFSPDGRSLLVREGAGSALLGLDGSLLARLSGPADFAGCVGGCRP
ncbi:MAG: hypothetical protein ACRDFY_00040 [Candidatus Limnocylindria bacterium]